MTGQDRSPQSDRPFRRWQIALAALNEAEKSNPHHFDVDVLAAEVIAARLALTQARIADGWAPHDAAQEAAAADVLLLAHAARVTTGRVREDRQAADDEGQSRASAQS